MQGIKQAFREAAFIKRLYILLFCICTCTSYALPVTTPSSHTHSSYIPFQDKDSNRVTLRVYRASLKQVLRMIEKQTGLTFAISSNALENARSITLQVRNQPLPEVLKMIFSTTRYAYEIRNKQIIVYPLSLVSKLPDTDNRPPGAASERFTVSGVVTDGERPLAGVSVREQETQNGTSSNENGRFRLSVQSGQAVLQLSLIGYETQEIPLRERRNLEVFLQSDTRILNDLVIIGYGIQKKANITGAIAKVEGRRLKSRPVTNVMAALQGTAPGLLVTRNNGQPGKEGFNIQIRGLSSGNNSEPLVLVDGAPGSVSLLNPNDIESVSVLKDAAAASIYGPLAAGGVVLVTTKRGKSGKISVEYNSLFGIETPINRPKRVHSWQAAAMQNEALQNAGRLPMWTDEEIMWMRDPDINFRPKLDASGNYNYYYDNNPLSNATRNNSTTQTYNISARGGNDDHQYLLSLGQFTRQGLFNTGSDNTSRTNVQFNANNRFSDVLSLETSLQYAINQTKSPSWRVDGNYGLLNFMYQAPGNIPVYVPGTNYLYTNGFNSYALLKDGGTRDEQTSFADAVFTLKAEEVLKGLTLKAVYSPQLTTYHDGLSKKTIPLYDGSGMMGSIHDPNSLKRGRLTEQQHSLQLLADYDLPAGKKNTVHILGGYAFESHYQHQQVRTGTGLSDNELANLSFNDPLKAAFVGYKGAGTLSSFFTRINYNFSDRFLLEANLVTSYLFFNSTTTPDLNRQHLFPSFSAGWRMNNEKWFGKAFPFFDEFKLRASWGMLGNFNWHTNLNDFNFRDQLRNPRAYQQMSLSDFDRYIPGNNNWETISTTNAGLDMAFLNGRLNINADYFVKYNRNMQIAAQTYPNDQLFPTFFTASMRSWGWELNLGWRDNRGPFSYWLNANIFDDQNKIEKASGTTAWLGGYNRGLEGLPYNAILGYKADGYFPDAESVKNHAFQGVETAAGDLRYVDADGNGTINGGDHTKENRGDLLYLGSTQPRYSYGFDAGFSWKGLDFSVFFQGIGQRNIYIQPRYGMPFVQDWQQPWEIHEDHWTPANPDAAFPRLYSGYSQNLLPSSFWIMNAAYIRLKNLQLGYTFHFTNNQSLVKSMRLYFSGQDLWEVNRMKIKYYDPEQAPYSGYQYPFFRSFTLGLNVVF